MKKSKRAKWISVLVLVMLFVYLDKPDRGGFRRCEALSGVSGLEDFATRKVPLWRWKPFEDPRFRFHMPVSKFDALKKHTDELGFPEWSKIGEASYGSFYVFVSHDDEFYYTKKYKSGKSCMFFYHPKSERLDMVIFYH